MTIFRITDITDEGRTTLEFQAVDGKTYSVDSSADGSTWSRIPMETTGETPETRNFFKAKDSRKERVHVYHPPPVAKIFYRLNVN